MSRPPRLIFVCLTCAYLIGATFCTAQQPATVEHPPLAPAQLRCEYLTNPHGIDEPAPRLSWIMLDPRRGAAQTAYQVLVAADPATLAGNIGNLWDTGRVESSQSIQIAYAGQPLTSRQQVWWTVRTWDHLGQPSPWSPPATWTMGLLTPADWHAQWIGDTVLKPDQVGRPPNNGYHSTFADTPDAEKWVQVDLGRLTAIDGIRLYPARPYDWSVDDPNFLFPLRFKILVSTAPDMAGAKTVIDRTDSDVPPPEGAAHTYRIPTTQARYVRLLATRLRNRDANNFGLAFAELEVLAGDTNLAAGQTASASDTIEQGAWSISRLVDGDLQSHAYVGMDPLTPPLLRKEFPIADATAVTRAVVYVTALGLYELHLNGQRVGDHQLAPEWTDYHQRVQYQTYDVTNLLRTGPNALGVQLADGWYSGGIGLTGIVPGGPPRAIYGRQPRLLLQLELHHADGQIQRIVSDDSWRLTTEGPLRVADLLDGEIYDARRNFPAWSEPGFDDATWQPAGVAPRPDIQLVAQCNEPIRKTRELQPIAVTEPQPNVYVFDLGQNFAGWCRLKVRGVPGQTITLRHAEVLNPDGTVYTDNLYTAQATDRYTLGSTDVETYEPRFTYHGFRYVEVTGLTEPPDADLLTGCVVNTDAPEVGVFECSDPLLNKLWQNIRWTQRANMYSIPTDCPQRAERLGWAGDIRVFAQTGCFNMDLAAFLNKWSIDMRDAQVADGRYPDFAPHPFDPAVRFSGVPAWGDAGVFVPWCVYQNYGDRRLLARHFESARRWVDWIHQSNPNLRWENNRNNDYSDWLNGDTIELANWPQQGAAMPHDAFATAFFARSTQIVADMACVLGRDADAQRYAALARDIRQAFNQAYVQPDGRVTGDTQAGYALALHFDLLPEPLTAAAAQHMVDCFARYHGRISTGIQSTVALMDALTRYGYVDDAYRLITNRDVPSWGYPIDHGATTVWERWDGYVEGRGYRPGMNSFSHYALGSVGEWMVRTIIGINPDPQVPAYQHFIIRPELGGKLTWARGSYDSIHGRIAVSWRHAVDRILLDVTVPPNTTATLYLPTRDVQGVHEARDPLAEADGITNVRTVSGRVVCDLSAGEYHFEVDTGSGS